jgi:hypothetical protein
VQNFGAKPFVALNLVAIIKADIKFVRNQHSVSSFTNFALTFLGSLGSAFFTLRKGGGSFSKTPLFHTPPLAYQLLAFGE